MPRPRKPKALRILEGTFRKDRHNADEPDAQIGIPDCPDHLDVKAQAEWHRVSVLLCDMGILAKTDMATLAGYCQNFSRWAEAEAGIAEQGLIVRSPNGYPVQNPFISIANEAARQMRSFASDLGLSATARAKVKATPRTKAKAVAKRTRA